MWIPEVNELYKEAGQPEFLVDLRSPMRKFYPTQKKKDMELLTSLTEVKKSEF